MPLEQASSCSEMVILCGITLMRPQCSEISHYYLISIHDCIHCMCKYEINQHNFPLLYMLCLSTRVVGEHQHCNFRTSPLSSVCSPFLALLDYIHYSGNMSDLQLQLNVAG